MSDRVDGQYVICDGEKCEARALAPVALRPSLPNGRSGAGSASAEGWLFVVNGRETMHFCPGCVQQYLERL